MRSWIPFLVGSVALAGLVAQIRDAGPADGLVVERAVRLTFLDTLGRRREVHRQEVVRIHGPNVSITDLTFGERLIIRGDRKRVVKADPLGGVYSELTFDEVAALRKRAFDEIRSARARVPGTADEKELDALLEGFDQFASDPRIEVKSDGARREAVVNGDRVRLSVEVDPRFSPASYFEALSSIGAFHPAMASRLAALGGFPTKGTVRYVLFLDRVVEQIETLSIRAEAVAGGEFDIPPGLKKVPLAGFERAPDPKPDLPKEFRRDFKEDEIERQQNTIRGGEEKGKP
jgi:hypothetical protein